MLGVSRTATEQEIKSAYRKLAMQFHPDRNPDNAEAEEKFKEATEAYGVLADAGKRAQYDRFGHAGVRSAAGAGGFDASIFEDFHDIFGDLFGFGDIFGKGGRRTRVQRGPDLREDLTLTFEEAVFGVKKEITYRRHETCDRCHGSGAAPGKAPVTCSTCAGQGQVRYQQGFFTMARTCPTCNGAGSIISDPCPQCRGQGRVVRQKRQEAAVPPGVEDGTRIRYAGLGEAGANGGPPGDLYIVLHVKEHPFFDRQGKDLYCRIPISFSQAALGAEVRIPTLDGDHPLRIPESTQTGTTFRLRHKGVPSLNGHGKGDLYVEVRVQTPSKLNKKQRELLRELESGTPMENKPEERTLLGRVKDMFS